MVADGHFLNVDVCLIDLRELQRPRSRCGIAASCVVHICSEIKRVLFLLALDKILVPKLLNRITNRCRPVF